MKYSLSNHARNEGPSSLDMGKIIICGVILVSDLVKEIAPAPRRRETARIVLSL
jgi:hypothetical protein